MTMTKGTHEVIPVRKETKNELIRIMAATGAKTYDDAIMNLLNDDEVLGYEQEEDESRSFDF